jgi:hypothetical protein
MGEMVEQPSSMRAITALRRLKPLPPAWRKSTDTVGTIETAAQGLFYGRFS